MKSSQTVDVMWEACPSRKVLGMLANKWTVLVIAALAEGTKRNSDLMREVEGISQKMLTQTLRELERNGLVHREVYPVVPPKVEYSLTDLGETIIDPVRALSGWAEEHFDRVQAAREAYDDER